MCLNVSIFQQWAGRSYVLEMIYANPGQESGKRGRGQRGLNRMVYIR